MTLNEIKSEVYKRDKNMGWLLEEFGTSSTYMYREIGRQNPKVISKIKDILKKVPISKNIA